MMHKKLWGGSYTKKTDTIVEEYTASIKFDIELIYEDILGSLVHANMLQKCNIIHKKEYQKIQAGLNNILKKYSQNKIYFNIQDEDIHMNIEKLLTQEIGNVAGKLHTARSRNDQVALDLHLYMRKKILNIITLLILLQNTLINLSQKNQTVIVSGYTHLQRAQPIYLSQYWLCYVEMFERDIHRLKNIWNQTNLSPLGACALTGTSFPIDRHFVAKELQFDGIYINTLDAVSNRDFIIEFLSASALIMMHLSRMSEELILWSSQEFNFIYFDEGYSTGSSIMPQKKNPDVAELARGKTGRVYGALISLLTIFKGLPLTYNKDMQEDKEPLFDTLKTLQQTLSLFPNLLKTLNINKEKMFQSAHEGFINATILAEYLVRQGLTFRKAHEIVGKMVSYCIQHNSKLENLTLNEMKKFCSLIKSDVYQFITIDNAVIQTSRNLEFDKILLLNKKKMLSHRHWLTEKTKSIQSVYKKYKVPLT